MTWHIWAKIKCPLRVTSRLIFLFNHVKTLVCMLFSYFNRMVPNYNNNEDEVDVSAVAWQQHFGLNESNPAEEGQWKEVGRLMVG